MRWCASPGSSRSCSSCWGPSIRQYGGKLNMKSAGYGSPVEWHQDWAFYPHTNDDVLATGIYLDDCDLRQRPAAGAARHASRADLRPSCRGPLLRRHEPGRLRPRFLQGGAADGSGRLDDHPSRAAGARLGAQPLQPPAPPAAARIHRRRRLPAAGHRRTSTSSTAAWWWASRPSSRASSPRRCACRCRRPTTRARSTRTSARPDGASSRPSRSACRAGLRIFVLRARRSRTLSPRLPRPPSSSISAPTHGTIDFAIGDSKIFRTTGSFKDWQGTVHGRRRRGAAAAPSLVEDQDRQHPDARPQQTAMLKDTDFFDVAKFPRDDLRIQEASSAPARTRSRSRATSRCAASPGRWRSTSR